MKKPSVVMALGLILGEIHRITGTKIILIAIILAFFSAGVFEYVKKHGRDYVSMWRKLLVKLSLLLAFYVLGFLFCDIQLDIFTKYDKSVSYESGYDYEGYGIVTSLTDKEKYVEIIVDVGTKKQFLSYEKLLLRIYKDTECPIPDNTYLNAKCRYKFTYKKPEEEMNYGNFNSKEYYHSLGIAGAYSCKDIEIISKGNSLHGFIADIKEKINSSINRAMGEKYGSVMSAMVTGSKYNMDADTKELYNRNGLAHVLAVSGLHISTVGMLLFSLLKRFMSVKTASVVSGVIMVLYGILTGGSVSCIRAVIMFILKIGGQLTGRKYNDYVAISVSAVIILISNPSYLLNSSFIMSYVAIISMTLLIPNIKYYIEKSKFNSLKVVSPMVYGVLLNLMMLPLICSFYYQVPLLSVFLNIIVVPLMTVVLISGLVCGISGVMEEVISDFGRLFSFVAGAVSFGSGMVGKFFLWIFEKSCLIAQEIPGTIITTGKPAMSEVLMFYGIFLILFLMLYNIRIIMRRKERVKRFYGYGLILSCVLIGLCSYNIINNNHITGQGLFVSFINVGQGDSIFIKDDKGNTYLCDCGSSSVNNVAKNTVSTHLKALGTDTIDYAFISHGDGDHTSGIIEMLGGKHLITIKNIVISASQTDDENIMALIRLAKSRGVNVISIEAGDIIKGGKLIIECLYPYDKNATKDSNEGSMVLKCMYGKYTMLLTGDIGAGTEELLVTNSTPEIENTTILKVAHHGSKNSSSVEFLNTVSPVISVISCSENNLYGHPSPEALSRLSSAGSRVFVTKDVGGIMFKIGKEINVCFQGCWQKISPMV